MLPEENNQPLHHYWQGMVCIDKKKILKRNSQIPTYELRHEYTNYDDLINSIEVQKLEPIERSRNIAIIKYECTTKAQSFVLVDVNRDLEENKKASIFFEGEVKRRDGIIAAITKLLFGNDKEINLLKAKLKEKDSEIRSLNELLKAEKVESEYKREIATWKKKFEEENLHRLRLARNNKSLGGRVSHANKWKAERDLYSELLDQTEISNLNLSRELEAAKRELNDYKVFKRKAEQRIQQLERDIRKLKASGSRNG